MRFGGMPGIADIGLENVKSAEGKNGLLIQFCFARSTTWSGFHRDYR